MPCWLNKMKWHTGLIRGKVIKSIITHIEFQNAKLDPILFFSNYLFS